MIWFIQGRPTRAMVHLNDWWLLITHLFTIIDRNVWCLATHCSPSTSSACLRVVVVTIFSPVAVRSTYVDQGTQYQCSAMCVDAIHNSVMCGTACGQIHSGGKHRSVKHGLVWFLKPSMPTNQYAQMSVGGHAISKLEVCKQWSWLRHAINCFWWIPIMTARVYSHVLQVKEWSVSTPFLLATVWSVFDMFSNSSQFLSYPVFIHQSILSD